MSLPLDPPMNVNKKTVMWSWSCDLLVSSHKYYLKKRHLRARTVILLLIREEVILCNFYIVDVLRFDSNV